LSCVRLLVRRSRRPMRVVGRITNGSTVKLTNASFQSWLITTNASAMALNS
jgi:hypothetical protein